MDALATVLVALIAATPPTVAALAAWKRSRSTDEKVATAEQVEELKNRLDLHVATPFHQDAKVFWEHLNQRLDTVEKRQNLLDSGNSE